MTTRKSTLDENGNEKPRTSVHEVINNSQDGRCNNLPNEQGFAMVDKVAINQTTELMSEVLPAYVSAIDFCKELDLVVCGMNNGSVI
jgi:hypothetical protein